MATPFVDPDAGRAPTPTMPFDSAVYDYRVRFPSGWSPEPSKAAPAPDVIEGVGYQWFGTARTVEPGTSLASFVRSHPLDRLVNGECVLRGAGSVTIRPPVGSTEWEPAEIAGRRALRRSSCGYVDAVVIAERTLYRFTLRRAAVEGDVESFERLAATIELPLAFRSKANGYRLTLPPGWEATKDWESDVFKAPKPSKAQISVTRRHLSGQPLDLFATGALPNRVTGDGCHWKSPGIIWIPAGARSFLSTTIAGRKALVRDECGFVDAVVDLGDDALVIVLRSGIRRPDGDRYTFDRLVESLQIEGRP